MMNAKEKFAARLTGISLLVMAVAAGISYGYVHGNLITDQALSTLQNLSDQRNLFMLGLGGWVLILITDIMVSCAVYPLFKRTQKNLAITAAAIRIVYSLILSIGVIGLMKILPLLNQTTSGDLSLLAEQVQSQLDFFDQVWSVGLIVFGFHLLILGAVALRASFVPRIFGYLLYLGGVSYVLIHGSRQLSLLNPEVINQINNVLAAPMALAEIALAIWLIVRSLRKK